MSVRQLSTDMRIALKVAEQETKATMILGGTVRDAIEAGHLAFNDVLRIARRDERL